MTRTFNHGFPFGRHLSIAAERFGKVAFHRATAVACVLGYRGPKSASHVARRIESGLKDFRNALSALATKLE